VPYDLRKAWSAFKRSHADPDDTVAVIDLLDALSGGSYQRDFERFAASETGREVLADKRDLLDTLRDRAYLESLPEGSFGRAYADFTTREQISADGLVEASGGAAYDAAQIGEDEARFMARYRDLHDLEHVVTGYGRDIRGEVALLTFDLAQSWSLGLAVIVGVSLLEGDGEQRRLIREAWGRGKNATWSPGVDWEALLPLPLEEVRKQLSVGEPPVYREIRSAGAPTMA
jgi:ubiquinone biosynthesis protein COQ4